MRSAVPSRRLTRLGAIPLLFLTLLGLVVGGLSAPAYAAQGTISGVVTRQGALTATPLSGVTVNLCDGNGSSCGGAGRTTTTAENGAYTLTVPPGTGSYNVYFDGAGYEPEFYDGAATAAAASDLTVKDDDVRTGINATLADEDSSEVGGRITTANGTAIAGATIRVYQRTLANAGTGDVSYAPVLGSAAAVKDSTDDAGNWSFELGFGEWLIEVEAAAFGTFYLSSTGNRSTDPKTAPLVEVKKGEARAINASLPAATTTTISGRVTTGPEATRTPVKDVTISVEYPTTSGSGQTTWVEVQSAKARTDVDGQYVARVPVPEGSRKYVVGFSAPGFVTQYYNGKNTREATTGSDLQAPTFSAPSTDIDAVLVPATQVTGKVTDRGGAPLSGVKVTPVTYTPNPLDASMLGSWGPLGSTTATTGLDGTYVLNVAPATPFRLQFRGDDGREVRWFPSATDPNAAQNLVVAQNQVLTGRNMVLPTLATLGGSVTYHNGTPYNGGGDVELWKRVDYTEQGERGGPAHSTWELAENGRGSALTDDLSGIGAFSLTLPSGSYRLKLVGGPSDSVQGFLPGLVGLDEAPNLTVGQEQSLSLQEYALSPIAEIRGKVTDRLGAARQGERVKAFYHYVTDVEDGAPVFSDPIVGPSATSAVDGSFVINVPSRAYRVGTGTAEAGSFHRTRTQSVSRFMDAADITVAGVDVDGIDIRLTGGEPINLQKPFITGIAAEGETLTANPGTWSGAGLTFQYQWLSAPSVGGQYQAIQGATGSTYAIPARLLPLPGFPGFTAASYKVEVTPVRNGAAIAAATEESLPTGLSVQSDPIQGADTTTENRQRPQVTGSAVVGETLTGTDGVWSEGGTFTYRWFADAVAVPGATSKTLVVSPELLGKELQLQVTETTNNPDRVAVSAATAPVTRGVLRNTTRPTISGTPTVGSTLTAVPGTWNDPSPTFGYQWTANGQPITGATTNTLVLTDDLVGSSVRVTVTASKPSGYTPGTASSESTAPVADDPTKVTNRSLPVVSGTAKVGEQLSTTNGTWTNEPTSFTYQWLADGVAVTGATQQTFVPTATQAGKRMSVRVTAAKTGLTSGVATSAQTLAVAPADGTDPETCEITVTGGPTVSGSPAVGNLLMVTNGTTAPDGVTASFQWLRDGLAITGATGATYRVVTADEGAALAVRVTYSKAECADVVRTAQAGTVPDGEPTDPVKPRIDTTKKIKGNKFVLKVTVTASTQDPVQGALVLKEGSKRLAGGVLNADGKRKLVVRGLKKGFHSIRLTFRGNDLVRKQSKTFTFTIR
jgi:large repetitive protein